jgi:hypothetical protein
MLTEDEKKQKQKEIRRTRINLILTAAGVIVAMLTIYFSVFYQKVDRIKIEDPLKRSENTIKILSNNLEPDTIQGKLHERFANEESMTSVFLYELDNKVSLDDSISTGIVFNLHNDNDFSVPIEKLYIEVVSFTKFDSFLNLTLDDAGEYLLQTFTCSIQPHAGFYLAEYQPDEYQDEQAGYTKYLKMEAKDSETISITLDTSSTGEDGGVYILRIAIQYSLDGQAIMDTADFQLKYVVHPSDKIMKENCLFYGSEYEIFDDGTYFDDNENISYGIYSYDDESNKDRLLDNFLVTHYVHPDLYKKAVLEVIDFLDTTIGYSE